VFHLRLAKMLPIWKELWPTWTTGKEEKAWKAFVRFWVAGTVGGFLATLMRSVPLDFEHRAWPPDWAYTLDLFIRYGYLVWLMAYFFFSNLRDDDKALGRGDVLFDVFQTLASFAAAYALGFAVPGKGFGYGLSSCAFEYVNWTIFTICAFSLPFGGRPITHLRILGGLFALFSLVTVWHEPAGLLTIPALCVLASFQAALWLLLIAFGRVRVSSLLDPNVERCAGGVCAPSPGALRP
jgi:hypothetical protein